MGFFPSSAFPFQVHAQGGGCVAAKPCRRLCLPSTSPSIARRSLLLIPLRRRGIMK